MENLEQLIENNIGVDFTERTPMGDVLVDSIFEAKKTKSTIHNDGRTSIPGFKETTNFDPKYYAQLEKANKKKVGKISKFFSNLSRWGMSYDEDLVHNMRMLPADKGLLDAEQKLLNSALYGAMGSAWKTKDNKDKDFNEKDFCQKRDKLRALALAPELEDILDTMANECIVYDANQVYFANPFIDPIVLKKFQKDTQTKIEKSVSNTFNRLYKCLNWSVDAWNDFKKWLIEGILAWEIVYDSLDKPTKILGMVPLDPATLTKKYKNGKWYWVQFAGVVGKERTLLDSNVVYIQFQETKSVSRLSYLERLIRPFNIYRIIEQAQIIWTITNAQWKMKFTIPIKGMNRAMGQQTVAAAMNSYREELKFNSETGEFTMNGRPNMDFTKEYWLPESDAGSPQIETISSDGPDLNDNEQLSFFRRQLYKVSKIPFSRFDQESGDTWFGADASSVQRTEMDFGRYVARLRNIFSQIILKPIKIQLCLDVPELADNLEFLNSIMLRYNSYNIFEKLMEQEVMQTSVDFIQTMKDSLVDTDANGNEVKYFSNEMLVRKYLNWSDDDIKLNAKLVEQERNALNEQSEEAAAAAEGGGGEDDMADF